MRSRKTAQVCGLHDGVARWLDSGEGDGGRWRIVANVMAEGRWWTGKGWEEYGTWYGPRV